MQGFLPAVAVFMLVNLILRDSTSFFFFLFSSNGLRRKNVDDVNHSNSIFKKIESIQHSVIAGNCRIQMSESTSDMLSVRIDLVYNGAPRRLSVPQHFLKQGYAELWFIFCCYSRFTFAINCG